MLQKSAEVGRKLKASTSVGVDPNTAVEIPVGAVTTNAGVSGLPAVQASALHCADRSGMFKQGVDCPQKSSQLAAETT